MESFFDNGLDQNLFFLIGFLWSFLITVFFSKKLTQPIMVALTLSLIWYVFTFQGLFAFFVFILVLEEMWFLIVYSLLGAGLVAVILHSFSRPPKINLNKSFVFALPVAVVATSLALQNIFPFSFGSWGQPSPGTFLNLLFSSLVWQIVMFIYIFRAIKTNSQTFTQNFAN